ncbi:hypothetical protein KC853_00490 [Candidatus Saccharibacteria bacterium]|nr:hypothetical protein [Candidatus Saccharibacteria bacterium]
MLEVENNTPEKECIDCYTYLIPSEVFDQFGLDKLPVGYCYMGGVARSVAIALLCQYQQKMPFRDIDIVAITDFDPDPTLQDPLSEKYMPEDYSHGHGIKRESFDDYFRTRDFTVNQVLIDGDRLIITPDCQKDLLGGRIRPTDHELSYAEYEESLGPKLTVKAILLEIVFQKYLGVGSFDFNHLGYPEEIRNFYFALALNKAFEWGLDIANQFTCSLYDKGLISEEFLYQPYAYAMILSALSDFKFNQPPRSDLTPIGSILSEEPPNSYTRAEELTDSYHGPGMQYVQ